MKVGVIHTRTVAGSGGGHTFETEILSALLQLAPKTHHEFVIFADGPTMAGTHCDWVSIHGPRLRREFDRLQRLAWTFLYAALPSKRFAPPGFLERLARTADVQFMWHLGPALTDAHDLPYAVPVWDLQHRLQPWFPEVSARGEWDARERFWSRTLLRAAVVIAGTEAGRREIMQLYNVPAERIRLLPHPTPCVDKPANAELALRKYALPDNFILYPAQFWPHKNHVNLLYALKLLRDQHQQRLHCVFVGIDKGNESHVRQVANELALHDHTYFLGFVPREDLIALYCRAFALVYVSFFGPENLPPLEAFALGCPVIAARVPGAEEQLADAALLVDPANPRAVADAILSLLDNPNLRQKLVESGKKRAQRFSASDFVHGMCSIIDEFEPIVRCWPTP